MLQFLVGEDGVYGGVPRQHLGVVGIGQNADPGVGVRSAQTPEKGRGADQVANVVATDDQDSHDRA